MHHFPFIDLNQLIEHDVIGIWQSKTDKEWQFGWVGKASEF